jgi:peroxiredoxin
MPKLNELVDKFKDKDVVFIAPTWDNEATLRTFLKEHPFKYHVVPNAGKLAIDSSNDGAGHIVFPTHIVIDKNGKISAKLNGPQTLEDLSKAIERLANTPPEHTR